jgi:hypothetical protein
MITSPPAWRLLHVCCSLKELVRRVAEQRALELTERLCEKVLSTSKKDTNARDVARWGGQANRQATQQQQHAASTGQYNAVHIQADGAHWPLLFLQSKTRDPDNVAPSCPPRPCLQG